MTARCGGNIIYYFTAVLISGCTIGPPKESTKILPTLVSERGAPNSIEAITFAREGANAITASREVAILWDLTKGRELRRFDAHSGNVLAIATTPQGSLLITGDTEGSARLWDLQTGKVGKLFVHRRLGDGSAQVIVIAVAISADGDYAWSVSKNDEGQDYLWFWKVSSGALIRRVKLGPTKVAAAVFSGDSTRVLVGYEDATVVLYDCASGKPVVTIGRGPLKADSIRFKRLAIDSHASKAAVLYNGTVASAVYDLSSGHELWPIKDYFVETVAFNEMGTDLLEVTDDFRFDPSQKGEDVDRLSAKYRNAIRQLNAAGFSFSQPITLSGAMEEAKGPTIGRSDINGRVYDADSGGKAGQFRIGEHRWIGGDAKVEEVDGLQIADIAAFSPNGSEILVGGLSRAAGVLESKAISFSSSTGQPNYNLESQVVPISAMAIRPDSASIVLASEGATRLREWDLIAGKPTTGYGPLVENLLGTAFNIAGNFTNIDFVLQGQLLMFADQSTIHFWNLGNGSSNVYPRRIGNAGLAAITDDRALALVQSVTVTCRVSSDHSLLENGPVRVG